ncbi:MAG: hypothetical protein ACK5KO_13275 [Arachnia sp.]
MQILVDPADTWTKVLPMWSTREIATYAVEGGDSELLVNGLAHAGIAAVLWWGAAWALGAARVRTRAVPVPA